MTRGRQSEGRQSRELPTTKQVHGGSHVNFGWGCGGEDGGRGAEHICWGGQGGDEMR